MSNELDGSGASRHDAQNPCSTGHTEEAPAAGFVVSPSYARLVAPAAETIGSGAAAEGAGAAAGGAGAGGLGPVATALGTVGAAVAALGGVVLAGETVRAAVQGEKTPIDVADEFYHTHFGDIAGWLTGKYSDKQIASQKQSQLQEATEDTRTVFSNSPVNKPAEQCGEQSSSPKSEPGVDPKVLRKPKEESVVRDKKRGFDAEKGTKDGKDMSWQMWEKPPKGQNLIYVKLKDGTFRFAPRPKPNPLARTRGITLPHTMLGKGDEVIGAGECETDGNGKITRANNFSGHYQPNEANLKLTKDNMEKQGLSGMGTGFEVFDRSGQVIKTL